MRLCRVSSPLVCRPLDCRVRRSVVLSITRRPAAAAELQSNQLPVLATTDTKLPPVLEAASLWSLPPLTVAVAVCCQCLPLLQLLLPFALSPSPSPLRIPTPVASASIENATNARTSTAFTHWRQNLRRGAHGAARARPDGRCRRLLLALIRARESRLAAGRRAGRVFCRIGAEQAISHTPACSARRMAVEYASGTRRVALKSGAEMPFGLERERNRSPPPSSRAASHSPWLARRRPIRAVPAAPCSPCAGV